MLLLGKRNVQRDEGVVHPRVLKGGARESLSGHEKTRHAFPVGWCGGWGAQSVDSRQVEWVS